MSKSKKKNKFDYTLSVEGNKVTATSHYAGQEIIGSAKCSPEDIFDLTTGVNMALARCDYKVAVKRFKNAVRKYENAEKVAEEARAFADKMASYLSEAKYSLEEAENFLKSSQEEERMCNHPFMAG